MDRWKQRWEESEKRREEERRWKERKSQKKEDPGARKGRKVAKHDFSNDLWLQRGSKSRLAKAAGAEPAGQMWWNGRMPRTKHRFWGRKFWASWEMKTRRKTKILELESMKIWRSIAKNTLVLRLQHVSSRFSGFLLPSPCLWGKPQNNGFKHTFVTKHGKYQYFWPFKAKITPPWGPFCMYVCMCACMYVCMYACMHACMDACMSVCMYVCMYKYNVRFLIQPQ